MQRWLAEKLAESGEHVNSGAAPGGCCSDFADAVAENLGGVRAADALGVEQLGIDNFHVVNATFDEGRPIDRQLLARHWPKVLPPEGLSWDDLDRLSEDAGFSSGTHVWLTMDGLHYDAEAPEGVENFFELPFFRRVVAAWVVERNAAPTP